MANILNEITEIQEASSGNEVRQSIIDALNAINNCVLPSVTSIDSGKILKVNSSGEWIVTSMEIETIPSATGISF